MQSQSLAFFSKQTKIKFHVEVDHFVDVPIIVFSDICSVHVCWVFIANDHLIRFLRSHANVIVIENSGIAAHRSKF